METVGRLCQTPIPEASDSQSVFTESAVKPAAILLLILFFWRCPPYAAMEIKIWGGVLG